jgi:hypothetical protein
LRRRSLERALAAVGSVAGLARRLLVTESTVRAWLRASPKKQPPVQVGGVILRPGDEKALRAASKKLGERAFSRGLGITPAELRKLQKSIPSEEDTPDWKVESLLRELDSAKRKSREEEQTFNELLKLAGEATIRKVRRAKGGKLVTERVAAMPKSRTKEGRRSGLRTAGYQWVKAFRRELSQSVIREVEAWSHSFGRGKGYPLWQATALLAQFALHPTKNFEAGQRPGSPKPHELIVQLPHDQAGSFNIEMPVATRAAELKSVVTEDLIARLTVINDDPLLRSFVYSVRYVNYRRRTPVEKRDISTTSRRKRRETEKRRDARAAGKRRRAKAKKTKTKTKTKTRRSTAARPPLRGATRASREKKQTKKKGKRK